MRVKAVQRFISAAAVAAVLVTACSAPSAPSETPTAKLPTSSPAVPTPMSTPPPPQSADATVVDITIAGGVVTPTNGQVQGEVGKPIVLQVDSDVADSLHVHSVPEHTFQVEPRPGQEFEFTVDVPGQVDIELHDLNRTVVTIQVRP